MTLKRRIDVLDGGQDRELTQEDWIWILDALEGDDPVAILRNSRRADLAPVVQEYLLRHGEEERERQRLRREKLGSARFRPAPTVPDAGS
jgi:hypothetical protein